MAPTRRSTRSTDQGVVKPLTALSPSTRTTRARPATKPNAPVVKSRAKTTRKTASRTQAAPQAEEEEEEGEQEEKPKVKSTRKTAPKTQIVPEVGDEGAIATEEVENVVTARRSTRAMSIASLQSPAKSKAARGRVTKKVASTRRTRGAAAIAEASNDDVSNADGEDPAASRMATRRGRKLAVETVNSTAPITPAENVEGPSVVVRIRLRRGEVEESKNPIEEPVVAKSSVDSATPSWAKRRGGRRTKVVEDTGVGGESVDQQTEVGGVRTEAANTEIVENIKTNVEDTGIEVSEPEPVAVKGKGRKRGKKVGAIAEGSEAAEPEPVVANEKGSGVRKNKKVDFAIEVPESTVKSTNVKILEPESIVAKRRRSMRGTKAEVNVHKPTVEDINIEVAEFEPVAARERGRREGKKVSAVAEEPEAIVESTGDELAGPEPVVAKGRGRKKGKKVVHDAEITKIDANRQTGTGDVGINAAAVRDNEIIVEEVGVAEFKPVVARGRGRRAGKKVDVVTEEPEAIIEDTNDELAGPEPMIAKGRGRRRGRKVIQDVKGVDGNIDRETEVNVETEIANIDTVAEAVAEQPEVMVEDTKIEATAPVVKGERRKRGRKATPTRRNTRKGQKAATELPEAEMGDIGAEMSDIDVVQTQQTEADVDTEVEFGAEQTVTTPTVKDSGVFIEFESIEEKPAVESSNFLTEQSSTEVIIEGSEVMVQESNVVANEEPVVAIQPEVVAEEVEAEVTTREPVAVESKPDAEQAEAVAKETGVMVTELSKVVAAKSPGRVSKKISPKSKEKAEVVVPIENVEVGESPVESEKPEFDTGLELAIEELSTDVVEDSVQQAKFGEGMIVEQEEVFEETEDEEPDLPPPFSSPAAKPTIILSPRRTTPDPDLDPIKTPVPSSPTNSHMSHPLNSSPLRQNNSDTLVLASPRQVTTPSNSPSKKRSTPNARTPISRLPESSTPFVRKLEDSRDANVSSISTPARGQNMSVASSPIMMPPATPDAVAGDARSPIKQTPTKESEAVRDVMIGEVGERSLPVGSTVNINSSPIKNPSPIKAAPEVGKSSPVGRLSFGGSEIPQSSPLVGRLEINDPNLLLSSPLTVPSKTFSPTKAQQSSPTRSSPLKYSAVGFPQGFLDDETVGGSSFANFEGDYNRINEPDDDEEGEEEYEDQEAFEYGEAEVKSEQPKTSPAIEGEGRDEIENGDFDATIDESKLFKLAEKARLEGDAQVERQGKERDEKEGNIILEAHQRNVLTSGVSDFEVSCLEQVHPELDQVETRIEDVQTAPKEQKEQVENKDVAEGDLTFSDCVGDGDSIPSSPIQDITSPIKFEYRPTSEIFPSREPEEVEGEDQQSEPFSPIDIDFFSNRSFDTSAADWREDGGDEGDEGDEEDEEEPNANSPGGRLRHFRASSPPNIWLADEQPNNESLGSEASVSPVPKVVMPWDESGFDFSEEFIRPPTESPEPSDEHSFDFSKRLIPEESATDNVEKIPSPAVERQESPSAAKGASPITFEAGGAKALPITKARKPKAKTDTWLGKKGLQPKGEKGKGLPALEMAVNEEDTVEMKGGKRMLEVEGDEERSKRIRKDTETAPELSQVPAFLLSPKSGVEGKGGEKGRRQTFGGRPMARATGSLKRRKSFPEGPVIPDRQSYLYASDPERILRHWAQYEKDQAAPEPTVLDSPLPSIAANHTVASHFGGDLQHPVRPSHTPPRPRRLRSVSSTAASPSAVSGSSSPPSSGQGKRKAVEHLDTGRAAKSSIPISRRLARRPFNSKTQEEANLVKKNTEHNALYSCKLDYEPVQMSVKRPPSLDHNEIRRLSAEARRKRNEAEVVLRPGEDEAFIAEEEQEERKGIKWDDQLEYGCGSDLSERPRSHPEYLPNKGILIAKPCLNAHGNWVPTPGAPPLKIPQELVVIKKIVYKGEETKGKGGKK